MATTDFEGKREAILERAQYDGIKWGTLTGAIATGAVWMAHNMSPAFRNKTNVSARVALAISPALAIFAIEYERTMVGAQRDPAAYNIFPKGHVSEVTQQKVQHLSTMHRLANYAYSNPFVLLGGVGVPAVAGIFYSQSLAHPNLQLSQRVLHTRVLGQMTVLGVLAGTMMFRDYMYRNGGLFVEDEEGHVHREREGDSQALTHRA